MSSDRKSLIGFCSIAIVIAILLLAGSWQDLTGDETRYFMYATSLWRYGRFHMTMDEWAPLYLQVNHRPAAELPLGDNPLVPMNGVYLASLLAPVAGLFRLEGVRAVTLLAGLIGLFHLFLLCRRIAPRGAALFAVGMAALTMPLLPYLHLFFMETYLFAAICVAWWRLQSRKRGLAGDLVTAMAILVIPFVHMRGSVTAALLFGLLLWELHQRGLRARAVGFGVLGAAMLALLVGLNLAIYGAVTGPVNTARPPLPQNWFPVLAMQLFNVRHGLFAYAPIWLLGYAGLWVGAIRGPTLMRQAFALAAVAAVTGVGVNPGECWPARFWVQSIPMLALGFCFWWQLANRPVLRALACVLFGFTLVNTVLFVTGANDFLENRQTASTYQLLFERTGVLHFGLMLPVELGDPDNIAVARNCAIGAGLFILFTALAALRRRTAYAIPAILLVALVIDLARVRVLPPSQYQAAAEPMRLRLDLHGALRSGYVQLGHHWETLHWKPDWNRFSVTTASIAGGLHETVIPANQVVAISCPDRIATVTIETTERFDMPAEAAARLAVYRSRSAVRRWFPALGGPCQSKASSQVP